jgi:hypothetical protein
VSLQNPLSRSLVKNGIPSSGIIRKNLTNHQSTNHLSVIYPLISPSFQLKKHEISWNSQVVYILYSLYI